MDTTLPVTVNALVERTNQLDAEITTVKARKANTDKQRREKVAQLAALEKAMDSVETELATWAATTGMVNGERAVAELESTVDEQGRTVLLDSLELNSLMRGKMREAFGQVFGDPENWPERRWRLYGPKAVVFQGWGEYQTPLYAAREQEFNRIAGEVANELKGVVEHRGAGHGCVLLTDLETPPDEVWALMQRTVTDFLRRETNYRVAPSVIKTITRRVGHLLFRRYQAKSTLCSA